MQSPSSGSSSVEISIEHHIGRVISIPDRIRWVRLSPHSTVDEKSSSPTSDDIWWPGILYQVYDELLRDIHPGMCFGFLLCIFLHILFPFRLTFFQRIDCSGHTAISYYSRENRHRKINVPSCIYLVDTIIRHSESIQPKSEHFIYSQYQIFLHSVGRIPNISKCI